MRGVATDHTGKRYGRLKPMKCVGKRNDRPEMYWRCLCNPEWGGCGRLTTVNSWSLTKGWTRSCGCLVSPPPCRAHVKVMSPEGVVYDTMDDAGIVHGRDRQWVKNQLRARNKAGVTPNGWRRVS